MKYLLLLESLPQIGSNPLGPLLNAGSRVLKVRWGIDPRAPGFSRSPWRTRMMKNFRGLDADPNLGLGEELRSLLNYLRTQCDRVMKSRLRSMPGLPLHLELSIHNSLIFQLERG